MEMTLTVWGIILAILGALVLLLNNIFTGWHQKTCTNPWYKRYWWMGWKPLFKISPPSEKPKWKIKWNHQRIREGIIPPKYFWEIFGFLLILIGAIFQIIEFY